MMLAVYVFCLLLLMPVLIYFALNSKTKGILINCTFATFIIVYYIPLMLVPTREISQELAASTIICLYGLFVGFFFRFPNFRSTTAKTYIISSSILGKSIINGFFLIALASIIMSLKLAGGLFVVVNGAGGADYLNVRVNSPFSGILGMFIWLAPIPIVLFFYDYLTEPPSLKKKKLLLKFIVCLFLLISGYLLLTVRHNAVATVLALFTTYICITKFSIKNTIIALTIILSIIVIFQTIRVSGADNVDTSSALNSTAKSFEHVVITQDIINKTHDRGFTYFQHMLDVPIFFVPRAIWTGKPRTSFLNRYYFPRVAKVGSEKSIGIIGEGYSSYGYVGVFLIAAVFSFFISQMQFILDSSPNLLLKCFVASIIAPYTYIGIRTGVFGKHMLSMILMCIEAYIIYLTFSKNKKRHTK